MITLLMLMAFSAHATQPNFLFLFTDDQRFDTIRALGNSEVLTPNMDRLVRRGVSFTQAAIMGGTIGAVCMPSRAMLMTGQSLFQVHDHTIATRPPDGIAPRAFATFPELLAKAGYDTFATGKWHNGPKMLAASFNHGANHFFGGMSDHDKVPVRPFDPGGTYPKESITTGGEFSSRIFADSAIRFLNSRGKDRPFLVYVAFTSPHDPRMAPEQFTRLYPESRVKIPANFLPQHPFDNGELKVRDELLAPHPRRPEVVRQHIAAYYAMISEVDFHIGRVLDALEKSGLADNTYIFLASDNGLAVGRHGLFGKQNSYDHSMRIPLVVSGPGIPKNKRSAALCYLMDAGPTILDLAGVPAPEMAARSLRPVLNNPRAAQRLETVFAYRHFQRALRTPRHKLIEYNVNGARTTQLFDLAVDPGEMRDLAGKSEHKELVLSMRGRLQILLAEYGDRTILDSPAWPEFPR